MFSSVRSRMPGHRTRALVRSTAEAPDLGLATTEIEQSTWARMAQQTPRRAALLARSRHGGTAQVATALPDLSSLIRGSVATSPPQWRS
jgi:hypothetical protein